MNTKLKTTLAALLATSALLSTSTAPAADAITPFDISNATTVGPKPVGYGSSARAAAIAPFDISNATASYNAYAARRVVGLRSAANCEGLAALGPVERRKAPGCLTVADVEVLSGAATR